MDTHERAAAARRPVLARHVVATRDGGRPVLLDTLSGIALDAGASAGELEAQLFLEGQEEQAIRRALFRPRETLALTVISTWECNLRCTHCSVVHRLVREQHGNLDPSRVRAFVDAYRRARPETLRLRVTLLGGEPLLRPRLGLGLVDALRDAAPEVGFDTTTNLAVEIGPRERALLDRLDRIVVSLDGIEAAHDAQRRPYRADFSPWQRTMGNLERLASEGLAEKIWVQGAIRDSWATSEHYDAFHRRLVGIGIRYDRIAFETIHPAPRNDSVERTYLESLRAPSLRPEPCCKFRGAGALVIDHDGTVRTDFYDMDPLGTLDDPPEALFARHEACTLETMPALADPACRECPALGVCWGGCTSGRLVTGDRPSRWCDREARVARLRQEAADGTLVAALSR